MDSTWLRVLKHPVRGATPIRAGIAFEKLRQKVPFGRAAEVTTISLEHGFLKVMVSRGLEVLDFRIAPTSPRFFREGLVSNSTGMAGILNQTLGDMAGRHARVIGAVPGYQTALRRIELPTARGMNKKVVIPREAQRLMGISAERSLLAWHPLDGAQDRASWLVLSATRRSATSLLETARRANLKVSVLELRPFALARAVNQSDAVIVWTAADGCEVALVREWIPLAHQAAFWGAEPAVEGPVLVNRLVEVVDRAIAAHDEQNPERLLPDDTPFFVSGTPVRMDQEIPVRLSAALGRAQGEMVSSLTLPSDFPVHDLITNIGLALWEA